MSIKKAPLNQTDKIFIEIPQRMSHAAKAKLHEFIDALVETNPLADANITGPYSLESSVRALTEALNRNRNPKLLRYLSALVSSGKEGLTLKEIGAKTGAKQQELGGISSAVTRIWRKTRRTKEDVVIKGFHKHYVNPEIQPHLTKFLSEGE